MYWVHALTLVAFTCVSVPAASQETKYGDWWHFVGVDEMTDEVHRIIGTAEASIDVDNPFVEATGLIVLTLTCRFDSTLIAGIAVTGLRSVGFGSNPTVQYRFDSKPASEPGTWDSQGGEDWMAVVPPRLLPGFVGEAKSGRLLRVRVRDGSTTKDFRFSLNGFTQAYSRLPCAGRF